MTTDAIRTLVQHAVETSSEDIPPAAMDAARIFLLDSLGVGIAGSRGPFVDELLAVHAGEASAGVLGHRMRVSAGGAALVNAYQIHNSEFDCVHEVAVVHPMAVLLGAVLAWLDGDSQLRREVSGRELLAALVLGVDVACHIGGASRSTMRFFRPATAGAFAATSAIARLSGLDVERTVDAAGITLGQLSGTMQAHTEGAPLLAMQVGFNARNALLSCELAARGVPGPQQVLEGPFGYFALFEGDSALEEVLDEVGRVWRITEVAHKPFPSGRATHGMVDLCLTLREEHAIEPARIRRIIASVPPLTQRLVGRAPVAGMQVNYARLCAAFVAARALINARVGLEDFAPQALADAETLELAQRIEIRADDNPDPNALTPVSVAISLDDGAVIERSTDVVLGNPARALSREAHLRKFRDNWAAGAERRSVDDAERVIALVDRLDSVDDLRQLRDVLFAPR